MTTQQQFEVLELVKLAHEQLGSDDKVGNRCGVSPASINLIRNQKWDGVRDGIWTKVASALGWKPEGWQYVETHNALMVHTVLGDAKERRMFIPIADLAGIGKSFSSKAFVKEHAKKGVFYLECREWGKREFLLNLARLLGNEVERGYVGSDDLIVKITDSFKQQVTKKPLMIIDQANSLKPGALRTLISIYNECEDKMGMVILGTENLEKEIKRGVRYNKTGYDEIDSRFGRNYIRLAGTVKTDVAKICKANGIDADKLISKIFDECQPVEVMYMGQSMTVVKDLRRVKRAIQRELLRQQEVT